MTTTTIDRLNGINSGVAIKAPCRVATTANITLSGEQTIDGVAAVTDDRVLVKNQTATVDNGIWVVSTGTWSRSPDFDGSNDVVTGTVVYVNSGTTQSGTAWSISTTGDILPGTTNLTFIASSNVGSVSAFIATLLDDADAATARATLGAASSGANTNITRLDGVLGAGSVASNTCIGATALDSNTTGAGNVAIGVNALTANTTGGTATTGNTAIGYNALLSNVDGASNVAVGNDAVRSLVSAVDCTGIGAHALYSHVSGNNCVAVGSGALYLDAAGSYNTAVGVNAGRLGTASTNVTLIGYTAGYNNTANNTVAIGSNTLYANTSGASNVAVGVDALKTNTTAGQNVAMGVSALANNNGSTNVAMGYQALTTATTAVTDVAVGNRALASLTSGADDTAVGNRAGENVTSGNSNVLIGANAGLAGSPSGSVTTGNGQVCIGDNNVLNAFVKVAWTVTSDIRDKRDIEPMSLGLDYISRLDPISYRFDDRSRYDDGQPTGAKADAEKTIGFSAQAVLAIETELGINSTVVNAGDSEHLRITETKLIPILVNAIKELKAEIDLLKASHQ